jgi:hypothetical protein
MTYCLSKNELEEFLDYKKDNKPITLEGLSSRIENAEQWYGDLTALSYLLSQVIERKLKHGLECDALIELFYKLPTDLWFLVQEIDERFVDYMMCNPRSHNVSLEDDLIELQNNYREFRYDRTIRY